MPAPPTWERPAKLIVGRVLAPHGTRGDLRLEVLTDFPERLGTLHYVYLGDDPTRHRVRRAQLHPPHALLSLEGIDTDLAAEPLRDLLVRIDLDQAAPLPEGEYYHWQLLGAEVRDEAGQVLGVLCEILRTGANDVYVVRKPTGGDLLVPAIGDVIRAVDTEHGVVTVRLLPGLDEL